MVMKKSGAERYYMAEEKLIYILRLTNVIMNASIALRDSMNSLTVIPTMNSPFASPEDI